MNIDYLKNSVKHNETFKKKKNKFERVNENILNIVEKFIVDNKLICYGGTAINNILPKKEQFYNYKIDIPDYDFFSYNAIKHTTEYKSDQSSSVLLNTADTKFAYEKNSDHQHYGCS